MIWREEDGMGERLGGVHFDVLASLGSVMRLMRGGGCRRRKMGYLNAPGVVLVIARRME